MSPDIVRSKNDILSVFRELGTAQAGTRSGEIYQTYRIDYVANREARSAVRLSTGNRSLTGVGLSKCTHNWPFRLPRTH